jgi:hypothetical protein
MLLIDAVQLSNGALAASYPDTLTPHPVTNNLTGIDTFAGTSLGVQWEWLVAII